MVGGCEASHNADTRNSAGIPDPSPGPAAGLPEICDNTSELRKINEVNNKEGNDGKLIVCTLLQWIFTRHPVRKIAFFLGTQLLVVIVALL